MWGALLHGALHDVVRHGSCSVERAETLEEVEVTVILPTFIVGVVCALVGWIIGYWNGARGNAERWDHTLADVKPEDRSTS
jgi:hypothetical protein